ncbi:MAG: DUF3459 domain-containing protein [Gemmatimonadetes bacterium]|nr:DUF3459 domain-containing protein [Gemmatimonadota bacterium]
MSTPITEASPASPAWWERGVVYQIYPRSFMDATGDGIGDLSGITSRLPYLRWLGVDAIWISPFYPSPMADFGYDVADYCAVDPMFGTLADWDALIAEAHQLHIRVILDFIPNHTSDQHPWFRESRSARDNPRRNWYLWRDPAPDGGPPNNWVSNFGGRAWTLDRATGQYYYHAYLPEQPDLNWRNPEVERAMHGVLRFWLDRGVDGFRVDALRQVVKDDQWRDNPPNPEWLPSDNPYDSLLPLHTTDRPELEDIVRRMRGVLDEYPERVMVGELYLTLERLMCYYDYGCHLPFNFQLIELPWDARIMDAAIRRYEEMLPPGAWPNWVLGNHDRHRIASRVGGAQARVAAMLLLTLRGTPTLYYGDELGMTDVPIPPEQVQDPWELRVPGLGLGRDPERTPMQWDASPNAGFTSGRPWLPVAADFRDINVDVQQRDPASLLCLHRRLLALRRAEPALSVGSYEPVEATGSVLAYVREAANQRFLVALNLNSAPASLNLSEWKGGVVLGTHSDREGDRITRAVPLRAHEGIVAKLD